MNIRKVCIIVFLFLFLCMNKVGAWENVDTHPELTREAVLISVLNEDFLSGHFGLTGGVNRPS